MIPSRKNKIFFVEKTTSRVSATWKGLHVALFFLIAANSFLNSILIGKIFKAFNYNCIIFCTNITFDEEIIPVHLTDGDNGRKLLNINSLESEENFSEVKRSIVDKQPINGTLVQQKFISSLLTESTENLTVFRNESIFVYSNEIETTMIHSRISLRKSRFPSNFLCNLTLCTVLMTFIWSLFFGVLMVMCSRGGRGYLNDVLSKPQNIVYPILVTSAVFAVLNLVVSSIFERGTNSFCENFEIFTHKKTCSSSIDRFTVQFVQEQRSFYVCYLIANYSFYIGIGLIFAQILITVFRILCVVDYQLYALHLEDKSQTETIPVRQQNSSEIDTTETTSI
ncbi:uncharacterized protein LOC132702878 [Cylas formicarius]|uniref:uncharacterized protein LOC132702878 n=1 Tax=Cylas formicarius TaxID=197179 RepID=UPI002958B539|nr:uncharacterized protein LOC132702878 [Cylas formicarius]